MTASAQPSRRSPARALVRGALIFILFVAAVFAVWEGAKALGGDPWRFNDASGSPIVYRPPFKWPIVSDLKLPHVWDIARALGAPVQRQQQETLGGYLIGAGTPEEIAAEPESATGRFLAGLVEPKAKKRRAAGRKRVAAAA